MSVTEIADIGTSVVEILRNQQADLAALENDLFTRLSEVRDRKRKIDGAIRLLTGETATNGSKRKKADPAKRATVSDKRLASVMDTLRKQPDRDWTIPDFSKLTGMNQATVNISFNTLRRSGAIRLAGKAGNKNLYRVEG